MNNKKYFILLIFLGVSYIQAHDFFFSYTWIQFNKASDLIEIQIKIDKNDLNRAVKKSVINIEYENAVNKYCQSKVEILINDKKLKLNYDKIHVEDEAVRVYFTTKFEEPKKIQINNSILHELFEDQINKIIVIKNDQKKYLELSKKEPQKSIDF
ncbi:MAG: hypothetical protein D8M58_20935 [Calditrichaeota bacterium]|nr:MAG: hypothetical protein DWQ03_16650 [Calditrichota bacterium]MBL1207877.1 hypothetical protein [Calditrichota bacterium]NOG47712.1 hypothetical protein [Calditrichota bacterium]